MATLSDDVPSPLVTLPPSVYVRLLSNLSNLPIYPSIPQDSYQNRRAAQNSGGLTCTVLFSRFDRLKLARVVGAERAAAMIDAEKQVHMFITGEA